MRNVVALSLLTLVVLVVSCKNDPVPLQPKADFTLDGSSVTSLTIGTYDQVFTQNLSNNSTSFIWDFGDGTTSTDKQPKVTYSKKGNYELVLTAIGQGGTKSVIKKNIIVKERVLKSIQIDKIYLNSYLAMQDARITFPKFSKLDLWVELKFSQGPLQRNQPSGDIIAPTFLKTPVYAGIDSTLQQKITYYLPNEQNVLINYPVGNQEIYQGGIGLFANLYGSDGTNTYLLYSSSWFGTSYEGSTNPIYSDSFKILYYMPASPTKLSLDIAFQ